MCFLCPKLLIIHQLVSTLFLKARAVTRPLRLRSFKAFKWPFFSPFCCRLEANCLDHYCLFSSININVGKVLIVTHIKKSSHRSFYISTLRLNRNSSTLPCSHQFRLIVPSPQSTMHIKPATLMAVLLLPFASAMPTTVGSGHDIVANSSLIKRCGSFCCFLALDIPKECQKDVDNGLTESD